MSMRSSDGDRGAQQGGVSESRLKYYWMQVEFFFGTNAFCMLMPVLNTVEIERI